MRHLLVQAGQIELVLYVILVHLLGFPNLNFQVTKTIFFLLNRFLLWSYLTEKLISTQATKPGNPGDLFGAAHC